jgi:hypothetical protein
MDCGSGDDVSRAAPSGHPERSSPSDRSAVDLFWLPLGAGGRSVRINGLLFEAVAARVHRRPRQDLYHSALEIRVGSERHVIEMAPAWSARGEERGVATEGAVGSRLLGRSRWFRYEIRCWRDGSIPDIAEAVESPVHVTYDPAVARRVLELAPSVPRLVWGRDELRTGDMWNSNSVIAWLVCRAGIDVRDIHPPTGGRAPGWAAGVSVASRPAP